MAVDQKPLPNFAAFWPVYVAEHLRPANRALHYVGGVIACALVLFGALTLDWRPLVIAPIAGYAFAWTGHAFVERNRPATWRWPLWSVRGELYMLWLGLTGRMRKELAALELG